MPDLTRIDSTSTPDALTFKAALDTLRDALAALTPTEVELNPGLDASAAAGVVIGSLPRIAKHRDALAAQFGAAGAAAVDDLPTIAYATAQSAVELAAADSMSDLSALNAAVLDDHALLLGDCDALANRKLLDRARVDAGRSTQGYRTTVTSTLVLVSLVRESWAAIGAKTPLEPADLDRVEKNAQRMLRCLEEREQGASRMPAAEQRSRALSLLIRRYGELRRMLTYVRWWAEDADSIAPSLWSGRRGKGRNASTDPAADDGDAPDQPELAVPVNGTGPFTA